MAIADTELKKSDADDTSTGGSKDTLGGGSKSPPGNKEYPSSSSSKMYYNNINDFAFNMPDGWDDRNIAIFLECCREYIDDLPLRDKMAHNEEKMFQKVAKSGIEKSGSLSCFTMNICMELGQCLKSYVLKNEKRIENEAFKKLYDDVIDLLPYFRSPSENKNLRHRSRSKSTEKKGDIYGKNISSVDSESSSVGSFPKEQRSVPSAPFQIEDLIITYCSQYQHMFGTPKTPVTYIWNKVSQRILDRTGVKVDVKKKLEAVKRTIAKELRKETDLSIRAKKFLILAHDYLPFFDYMPPRTIKKKDFVSEEDLFEYNEMGGGVEEAIGEPRVEENEQAEPALRKKRSSKGSLDLEEEALERVTTPQPEPQLPNLPKKKGRKRKNSLPVDSLTSQITSNPLPQPEELQPEITDFQNDSNNAMGEEPESESRTENSPHTDQEANPSDLGSSDLVFFETKYALRGVNDSVKFYKPRQKRGRGRGRGGGRGRPPLRGRRTVPRRGPTWSRPEEPSFSPPPPPLPSPPPPPVEEDSYSQISKMKRVYRRKAQPEPRPVQEQRVASPPRPMEATPKKKKPLSEAKSPEDCRSGSSSDVDSVKMNAVVMLHDIKRRSGGSGPPSVSSELSEFSEHCAGVRQLKEPPAPTSTRQLHEKVSQLENLDSSTVAIIERYKNKVGDAVKSNAMLQMLPVTQATGCIAPSVINSVQPSAHSSNQPSSSELVSQPPEWFCTFATEHKKHEMWKMHQLLKMQQELVEMENKKLAVLEKILFSLKKK